MQPPDLLQAFLPVVEVLETLDVAYYVGGSVASSAFGIARATADVDLVADLSLQHCEGFAEALEGAYYLDRESIRAAVLRRSSFNLLHLGTMIKVDIYIPKQRPFELSVRARAIPLPLSEDSTGKPVQLASPEDIVLSKLEWFELGGRVSERQWRDVLGVLEVQGESLDLAYLRRWADKLRVSSSLEEVLSEAGLA